MSTSMLSAVDAQTGTKIPLATFQDANGNTAVGHVALVGASLAPVSPGNPLPVSDSAAETALSTVGTNTAVTANAVGTPADVAWNGNGSGTLVAVLKALYGRLAGTLTASLAGPLPAGTNALGSVSISNLPATQAVSGTLTAGQGGAWTVGLASGATVGVAALPALPPGSNTIGNVGITGTPAVTVSNFPATQPVSGSVSISNFPVTQPVSGTIGVSGTVAVQDSAAGASLATIATNTAAPAARVLASRSVASTVASASTVLVGANAARRLLRVQAPQGAGVWLNLLGGVAGSGGLDCLYLAPGDVFEGQDTNAVTYWCATGGLILSAWEA